MLGRKDTALARGRSLALGRPCWTEGGLGVQGPGMEENM